MMHHGMHASSDRQTPKRHFGLEHVFSVQPPVQNYNDGTEFSNTSLDFFFLATVHVHNTSLFFFFSVAVVHVQKTSLLIFL
eukprot:SAG11_NODE_14_length_26344_cov_14.209411_12_plen_81_part_00